MREPLDSRYVPAQRVAGGITFAIFAAACGVATPILWLAGPTSSVWRLLVFGAMTAFLVLLLWLATVWPAVTYRHAWYGLDDVGLEMGEGVIVRRVTLVPRSRVQHTDVTQGPIERRFGLGTLVVHTAGTSHARVALRGLAHPRAMELRDALLPKDGADAV